jgi:hypothetical protein
MEDINDVKRYVDFKRPTRSVLNSIPQGKRLRLREGAYKQLKDREWIFRRIENNIIFLIHESGAYGLVVKIEDIDWRANDAFDGKKMT